MFNCLTFASKRTSCPALTVAFWMVVRKEGGTRPSRPWRRSSTTRLALHLAPPPRFSAMATKMPESSMKTYITHDTFVSFGNVCRHVFAQCGVVRIPFKFFFIFFLLLNRAQFLKGCLTWRMISTDLVPKVWIWNSDESLMGKSSRNQEMVGFGSPSNSTSKRALSCSNTRQGWIFFVKKGGRQGF